MSRFNDLEKQLAELEVRQHSLKQLLASPGWREVVALGEGAMTTRRQSAFATFARIRGFEDCFTMANLGSETAGIQFMLAAPHVLLQDIERDIALVRDQMKENNNAA